MIAVRINAQNEVLSLRRTQSLREGELAVDSIPEPPNPEARQMPLLVYDEGRLVYRMDQMPEPEPEPIPEPDPIPASELRRQAYEVECDPLLIASLGYTMEGDDDAAAACRVQYLTKKREIRERIPDEEA